jgi:hypothetical protein
MAWEFPAVSQSRIEFWKQPQYTRKGMLLFTILFGFFGLHHFMLRSPQTGLLFFLANILSLGYCYFYDIIQLASTPVKELNEYGMSLPWGAAGIAKGMWKCGDDESQSGDAKEDEEKKAPNPIWFFFYSLLLPLAPLAKLFSGDTGNAMIGFLNLTIMPLGWIILVLTALFEYFKLFAKPADVFFYDVDRAFPFTMLGWEKEGRSSRMRATPMPVDDECDDCDNMFVRMYTIFMRIIAPFLPIILPILRLLLPPQVIAAITASSLAVEQGAKTAKVGLETAEIGLETAKVGLETAKDVITTTGEQAQVVLESTGRVAKRVANLATQVPQASSAALAQASALASNPQALKNIAKGQTLGKLASDLNPNALKSQGIDMLKGQIPGDLDPDTLKSKGMDMLKGKLPFTGGAMIRKPETSYFDYAVFGLIAAVLGGGFLLHTGRTFADVIRTTTGPNDEPKHS